MEAVDSSKQIRELLQNAAKHLLHKEYDDAEQEYNQALEVAQRCCSKWQSLLLSLRGYCRFLKGQLDSAMGDFDRSIQLEPLSAESLIRRSQVYLAQAKFGHACEDLKLAGIIAPDSLRVGSLLEELDARIAQMKESDEKVKYPLKKKVSQIILTREIDDEELLVNFSGVREIDRPFKSARKSVLFRYGDTIRQYDSQEDLKEPEMQISELIPPKEEIELIEKEEEDELDPVRLHEQLSSKDLEEQNVLPVLSQLKSAFSCKSILKNSLLVNSPISAVVPKHSQAKRISVLSIKNIDGKVVHSNNESRLSIFSNLSEAKDRKIGFGYVTEGNQHLPASMSDHINSNPLKRKSSIRSVGSILFRKSEQPKFVRKDSTFSNKLNIDGKMLRHSQLIRHVELEKQKQSSRSSSHSSDRSLSSSHSDAEQQKPEPIIIKLPPKFVRKQSILKRVKDAPLTPVLKSKRSVVFSQEPPQDKSD